MSPAAKAVVVKSVRVVLRTAVPLLIDTPAVLIESPAAGIAAPEATFQTLIVQVPASTRMLQAASVAAKGTFT